MYDEEAIIQDELEGCDTIGELVAQDERRAKIRAEVLGPCNKCNREDDPKGGHYHFEPHCGCEVCDECGDHKGRTSCYCGWDDYGENVPSWARAILNAGGDCDWE